MAGTGRTPKAPAHRRNRAEPRRGEWTELRPPDRKRTPPLPARGRHRGHWSPRTRAAWKAWWADPASTQWSEADFDLVLHLADVFEQWVREPTASLASEVRQLRDSLGLTPKGRQDRRWHIPQADVVPIDEERDKRAKERRSKIRAVDPAVAAKA